MCLSVLAASRKPPRVPADLFAILPCLGGTNGECREHGSPAFKCYHPPAHMLDSVIMVEITSQWNILISLIITKGSNRDRIWWSGEVWGESSLKSLVPPRYLLQLPDSPLSQLLITSLLLESRCWDDSDVTIHQDSQSISWFGTSRLVSLTNRKVCHHRVT